MAWWLIAVREAIKRLPLQHSLLSNLNWLQPGLLQYDKLAEVLAAADCLPQVVNSDEKPCLQEEFMDYCTAPLPFFVKAQRDIGMRLVKYRICMDMRIVVPS